MMEIRIRNLTKKYGGKLALDEISLDINGGLYGLLGPKGAGKTTLLRIIATLMNPTSGDICIGHLDLGQRKAIRDILGYLPQNFSFYPQYSVYEVMDYLAVLSGQKDPVWRQEKITQLLQQVNLWENRDTKTRVLSKGMKRRLGFAQALINDPLILLVDEPTAGLDLEEQVRFRNLLSDFALERTVILSTHIVADVEFICENLAILKEGGLIYEGRIRDLVRKGEGKVWSLLAEREDTLDIRSDYQVISYVPEGDMMNFRLISNHQPGPGAELVKPTIEDVYLGIMGGVMG